MYYIGLDVHKKTIGYCVKDAAGKVFQEGKIGSTRTECVDQNPSPTPDDRHGRRRSSAGFTIICFRMLRR